MSNGWHDRICRERNRRFNGWRWVGGMQDKMVFREEIAARAGSRKQGYWAPVELKTLQKGREWV